jgi:hypothetical protein
LIEEVQARRNAGRQDKFNEELAAMRPLPARRLETLERVKVTVGRAGRFA